MQMKSRQPGPFPLEHAFVVQFAADTALDTEHMTGRVEHLLSGQAARFESLAMLQAFVGDIIKAHASTQTDGSPRPDASAV